MLIEVLIMEPTMRTAAIDLDFDKHVREKQDREYSWQQLGTKLPNYWASFDRHLY